MPTHTCISGSGGVGGGGTGGSGGMPVACMTDGQCMAPTPRCVSGFCVQCVGPTDCTGGQICDSGTQMCRACTDDSTCDTGGYPGGACLAGGCVPAPMVAFANCFSQAGCPGTGSRSMPFCNAQDAIDAAKPVVVLQPSFCNYASIDIQDRHMQLWGRGMSIRPSDNSDGVHITGSNANVEIHVLGVNGMGSMGLSGIFVTQGATAHIYHSTIHEMPNPFADGIRADAAAAISIDGSLIYKNQGWGIYVHQTPSYSITNTFVLQNGNNMQQIQSGTGGVRFDTGSGGMTNVFAFNTVAQNKSMVTVGAGVQCDVAATLADSLIPDNSISLMCTSDHSVLPAMPTPRDLTMIFVDITRPQESLTKCRGFHVNRNGGQASAVLGQGNAIASLPLDVDGDPHAAPPTVGADEPVGCN